MEIGGITIPVDEIATQLPALAIELWKYAVSGAGGLTLKILGWTIPVVLILVTLWILWVVISIFNKTWDKSESWIRRKIK